MASSARQRPTLTVDPDNLASPLRELRDYWASKCAGRAMPRRADIDPLDLPPQHMPYLSIIEVLPDTDDFRFRLLGTGITGRMGRDSTGKTVREVYAAADRAEGLRRFRSASRAVVRGRRARVDAVRPHPFRGSQAAKGVRAVSPCRALAS